MGTDFVVRMASVVSEGYGKDLANCNSGLLKGGSRPTKPIQLPSLMPIAGGENDQWKRKRADVQLTQAGADPFG